MVSEVYVTATNSKPRFKPTTIQFVNETLAKLTELLNWVVSTQKKTKKISVLNETTINVMSNYISNEAKVFVDQNLLWMNVETESIIKAKG